MVVGFTLMSLAAWPTQAAAQLTGCSLQGEYVLSGMMDTGSGPLYVGGLFVFQPPATCTPGVTGTVTIMVVYSPPGTPNTLYSAQLPFMGDDVRIHIGPGLLQGAPTGIVNGVITSMPLAGDGALRLTGFLSRRELPAGINGVTGPTGPAGGTGPTGPPARLARRGQPAPLVSTAPPGSTGPAGPSGAPGLDGPIGPTGPAGAAGVAGATGPAGATGADRRHWRNWFDGHRRRHRSDRADWSHRGHRV